jgi:flagellar basal body P-ring formation protein FlgA
VDGSFARTIPVNFAVDAYRDAWVARSRIAAGAAIAPAMLERAEVNVGAQPTALLARGTDSPERIPSVRSVRSLKAGEAISTQNTRSQAAVNRGDWVTLQVNTGAMRLESRAEVLQEGELGQMVKVRVAGAANPVEVLVVDRGRVEALP